MQCFVTKCTQAGRFRVARTVSLELPPSRFQILDSSSTCVRLVYAVRDDDVWYGAKYRAVRAWSSG